MRHGFLDHVRPGDYILAQANASGIAQGFIGDVPPGLCWYVERMTAWSTTASTTAKLEIFVVRTPKLDGYTGTVGARTGRQDYSSAPANDVSDESSPIYLPPGYFLVALWTGLNANDFATLTTQIAVHKLELQPKGPRHGAQGGLSDPSDFAIPTT